MLGEEIVWKNIIFLHFNVIYHFLETWGNGIYVANLNN